MTRAPYAARSRSPRSLALAGARAARGQISADQVRQRYDRQTKGGSIDEFARQMNSDDPAERLKGVKSMSESTDPKAVEYLVQALGDPDMRVKAKAIDSCGNLRATDATPVLIQQLFLRGTDAGGEAAHPRRARQDRRCARRQADPGVPRPRPRPRHARHRHLRARRHRRPGIARVPADRRAHRAAPDDQAHRPRSRGARSSTSRRCARPKPSSPSTPSSRPSRPSNSPGRAGDPSGQLDELALTFARATH